ncbi:MAG: WhiB family transcriptional regulator, partial [Actinomycetes bacterium]
ACRKHALAVQEPYGIWGGLSEDDRVAIIEQGERANRPVAVLTPAS